MPRILESRRLMAIGIFDLEDRYARELRVGESHPRPIGAIGIYLVGRVVDGQREEFAEPLPLAVTLSRGGYHLFFGRAMRWDGVWLRDVGKPAGTYIVRVESQFYQPAERDDVELPRPDAAYFFDLQPGVAYPFPSRVSRLAGPTLLRGSLHHQNGAPVAGALIEVAAPGAAAAPYRTGEDGQWVLAFPLGQPSGDIDVRITLPDAAPVVLTAQIVQGRETSLQQTGLRGWVVNATGFGMRGATIAVSGQAGQSTTEADGRWFYYFALDQPAAQMRVTATLPDGRSLSQDDLLVRPGAATMVPTFRFV